MKKSLVLGFAAVAISAMFVLAGCEQEVKTETGPTVMLGEFFGEVPAYALSAFVERYPTAPLTFHSVEITGGGYVDLGTHKVTIDGTLELAADCYLNVSSANFAGTGYRIDNSATLLVDVGGKVASAGLVLTAPAAVISQSATEVGVSAITADTLLVGSKVTVNAALKTYAGASKTLVVAATAEWNAALDLDTATIMFTKLEVAGSGSLEFGNSKVADIIVTGGTPTLADVTAIGSVTNTAAATLTVPTGTTIGILTPGTTALTLDANNAIEIGMMNGANPFTVGSQVADLTINYSPDGKIAALPATVATLTVDAGRLTVVGASTAKADLEIAGTGGSVYFTAALTTATVTTEITVGAGTFTSDTAATVYPAGTVFNPEDDSVTIGATPLALTTGGLTVGTGGKLKTSSAETSKITITASTNVVAIGPNTVLDSAHGSNTAGVKLNASADGKVVLTWAGDDAPFIKGSVTAAKAGGSDHTLALTGATLTAGVNAGATVEISAAVPHVDLSFATAAPSITLADGGSISTKGDGKVILEAVATNAGITGDGSWTYTASDEAKTPLDIEVTSAVLTTITGKGALAGSGTATLTAADATGTGITIGQSTTLDLSGGGVLAFVSGKAAVVTLAKSSAASDDQTDIGKLALSSTKSIYGGNSGTSAFSDKFVTGNETGADTVNNIYVSGGTGVKPTISSGVVTLTAQSGGGHVLSSTSVIHAY